MDSVSYSLASKQAQRIKKIIANPDSTSGIVTVPKTIASGETITIPTGRVAVLPNVQIDGVLNIENGGEVFIPSGTTFGDLDQRIDTLDSTTVKKTGDQTIAGTKTFSSNIVGNITGNAATATNVLGGRAIVQGTGNDYHLGGVEVNGNGTDNTVFPTIGFHQPGLYASSLQLRKAGDFRFYSQGGSSYANVTANGFIGNLSGNADTATKLATARTINGVSFDGGSNISVGLDTQIGVFSTPFTLDNTHKNKLIVCNNGITINLPTINTIKSGDLFYINNAGLDPLTLTLNGNGTNLNTLKVTGGETLVIQSDGGSYYRCISRNSTTPVYDFDTNLITPLSYDVVYRADRDLTLVVICIGSYGNGIEIVIGTTTSPTRVIARTGDDINSNTKYATLTAVIPAGLYFKVQGFGQNFEAIEITAYKHK